MKHVKVWDPFVRFFHWALVFSIIIQLLTAESAINIHANVGYFIICLLLTRIVWGVIGSKHARFRDFIYSPGKIIGYLKGLVQRSPQHYVGHNPAGGAMVLTLLFFLLLTTYAGLKTYGTEGKGPLAEQSISVGRNAYAHSDSEDEDDERNEHSATFDQGKTQSKKAHNFWKETHETLVGIVIALIIFHILGVIASSYVHRENLILAMITGKKKIE